MVSFEKSMKVLNDDSVEICTKHEIFLINDLVNKVMFLDAPAYVLAIARYKAMAATAGNYLLRTSSPILGKCSPHY